MVWPSPQDLLGTVEVTLGDMDQATRWYLAAVEGFGGLGDREGMASALSMLSFCGLQYLNAPFGAAGLDLADRVARARQALEITQAISWRSGQALSTIALANLLGYHGSYREATAYVKRGLALAEELHHHYWRTLANLVRGAIRLDLLQAEAAVSSLETAFQLAREANSDYWARITSGYLVPALLELGRADRAREIVDTVIDRTSRAARRTRRADGRSATRVARSRRVVACGWARSVCARNCRFSAATDSGSAAGRLRFARPLPGGTGSPRGSPIDLARRAGGRGGCQRPATGLAIPGAPRPFTPGYRSAQRSCRACRQCLDNSRHAGKSAD